MEELFRAGGPVMWPLLGLSILSVAAIAERCFFWVGFLLRESEDVNKIVGTARQNLQAAAQIAQGAIDTPIGRFLYAPLALEQPDPELFKLALESAADEELANMLRGEKILESVVALAPLLGLLGTITGLIVSFGSLRIGDVSSNLRSGNLTKGIAEALITTASGLIVAIATLAFHRLFIALHHKQVNIFRKAGNDLELIYRQYWQAGRKE
ncbi:MotA/TolQ/ExbB proton channel family protein [Pseudanabaena sp. PCC 6802]|uniref:MotA/TolQ/ExbB proton channel family protein n=1 Tax=Pseudanabaena sp. PCC 6802 TaxID=118173 RepID=UPI0003449089|nr:MotA/TolQ/ExbB proton channel family protein [Pseudanabaena sp. PCC 6802]